MQDYSWLNAREYVYGVLASNEGKKFTGLEGNEGDAVPLDVEVEEGEMFVNFKMHQKASWWAWVFPVIIFAILTIVVFYIVYKYWKRRE
jgi:hypothetical protein